MFRDRGCRRIRPVALLLALVASGGALFAQGIPVEPLTIRLSNAIGAPGGQTAIVFRTYASRPVRRGRLAMPPTQLGAGFAVVGAGSPIATVDGAEFYTPAGTIVPSSIDFEPATQSLELSFDNGAGPDFFNSEDGVLGVIFVTLDAGVSPGATFALNLDPDPLATFFTDPEDDDHLIEIRGGELDIRAPAAPFELEVAGGTVHPGSGAEVEVGTAEPFAIEAGELVIEYQPAHFFGPPTVVSDDRHGTANLVVTYPAANRVKIALTSPADDFNRVPGDLLRIRFQTRPTVPLGTISPLDLIEAESWLHGPGAAPLAIAWFDEGIAFEKDHGVFSDGFQSADPWIWSAVLGVP